MTLSSAGSRRKGAPENGPTNGTCASVAIGRAAFDVGVPTSPSRAKTRSWSIRRLELAIARSGS